VFTANLKGNKKIIKGYARGRPGQFAINIGAFFMGILFYKDVLFLSECICYTAQPLFGVRLIL
jgi:hypothetical protein